MSRRVIVFVLSAAPVFSQQGGEIIGESALSAGTAGASVGAGQSVVDSSSNPATLLSVFENSRTKGLKSRLDGMLRGVHYNTAVTTNAGEELDINLPIGIGPWFGYAERINDDWAWGLNIQPTVAGDFETTRNTTLNLVTVDPFDPTSPLAESRVYQKSKLLQLGLEPNLSVRLNESWTFGFGASIRHTTLGLSSATEVDFDTLQGDFVLGVGTWGDFFKSAGGEFFQATFDADASSSLPNVFLKLGANYETPAGGRIGMWLRPPSTPTDIEGKIDVDMRDDLGTFINVLEEELETSLLQGELLSSYDFSVDGVQFPAQIGLSYSSPLDQVTRWHSKAVFTQWSESMSGWTAKLSNPNNSEFTDYVGGDGSIEIDLGMQWSDSLSISWGFEHDFSFDITQPGDAAQKINDFTFRGGVGWSSNPVGGAALPGLTPYNQLHLALGFSSWSNQIEPLDWHMALVMTAPEKWTAGENVLLSDQSYDQLSQYAYSFMVGASYSF
ncbi:MAG: hypothetical protein QGF46_02595 [Planctomycetota bacterium]|jgi:long-subunit fatty acid transport protein|nr:hypothetical protein [Planctomycetota bacterium]